MSLSKNDMIAALRHMAEGEMEPGAATGFAKAMLAMIEGGAVKTAEDEPEHKEPDGDEAPKADAEEPDGDEPAEEEKASIAASKTIMDLAREVQTMKAAIAKRDEDEKRARLLASRNDLDPKVVSILKNAPISQVEFAVKTFPRNRNCVVVAPLSIVASVSACAPSTASRSAPSSGRAMSTFFDQPPTSRWYTRTVSGTDTASFDPYHAPSWANTRFHGIGPRGPGGAGGGPGAPAAGRM